MLSETELDDLKKICRWSVIWNDGEDYRFDQNGQLAAKILRNHGITATVDQDGVHFDEKEPKLVVKQRGEGDLLQIVFHPAFEHTFKTWLSSRGMELYPIPTYETDEDFPTFGIRPKEEVHTGPRMRFNPREEGNI